MARAVVLDAVARALAALDLERAVIDALAGERLDRVRLVAIGKAAAAMASGARRALGDRIEDAVVVTPADAGHPLPDAGSVRAAKRCLALASRAGDAVLLVLVSGGASALVCAPAPGVTLATKRAITRAMLASGATVQEINVVRKHLSRIKGGGLARAAAPRPVLTLIASDVIGGEPTDVGSGPSVADPSSIAEARALLRRHAPQWIDVPLVRTLGRDPSHRLRARIVASPEALARVIARELDARVLAPSQADVEALAAEYVARAKRMRPGSAIVRAAEPSVVVRTPAGRAGRGGRSSHLAALVARDLPPGVTFAAIATDGVDGSSGTAGAIVDAGLASRTDLARAIASFDTGPLHVRAGTALPASPSGHNLADVHVLVRGSRGT